MQVVSVRESFDRGDFGAISLDCEQQTRVHRLAINEDRAGTAVPHAATLLGTGQVEVFAQGVEKGRVW